MKYLILILLTIPVWVGSAFLYVWWTTKNCKTPEAIQKVIDFDNKSKVGYVFQVSFVLLLWGLGLLLIP